MENILNEIVKPEELERYEKNYQNEISQNNVTAKTQFEYAWCLVRSGLQGDIQKGVMLLEDLFTRDPDGKRDYIYYLAVGHTRAKEYTEALKYIKALLQIEPNNHQVLALEEYVREKVNRDTFKGLAVAGGAALVIGGIIGFGMAIAKNRTKSNDDKDKK